MTSNSVIALANAFLEELQRKESNSLHELIHISWTLRSLPNGIKHCSVQIQCSADCGWLIEAYGRDAELLSVKAEAIQKVVRHEGMAYTKLAPEMLRVLFPEIDLETQLKIRIL